MVRRSMPCASACRVVRSVASTTTSPAYRRRRPTPKRLSAATPIGIRRFRIRNAWAVSDLIQAVDGAAHASRAISLAFERPVDWFGLNHYSPVFVKTEPSSVLGFGFGDRPAEIPITPNGWPISPNSFRTRSLNVSGATLADLCAGKRFWRE